MNVYVSPGYNPSREYCDKKIQNTENRFISYRFKTAIIEVLLLDINYHNAHFRTTNFANTKQYFNHKLLYQIIYESKIYNVS